MRTLLILLCAVFLTGCGHQLTLISPPVDVELLVKCDPVIAQPLTTGDSLDLSRALTEAAFYGQNCKSRHDALVNAVVVRQQILESVKSQLEGAKK